jgi:hypothetical protein
MKVSDVAGFETGPRFLYDQFKHGTTGSACQEKPVYELRGRAN